MIFKETLIQSLSFAVRDSRFPPTYAAHFSVFLISLSYRQCPIRPFGAPSPRGEGWRYEENLRSTDLRASPRFVILSGEKGKVKMDKYTGKKMMLLFYMTSAGIAPYIRGEAATFIPHSSFLIQIPSPLKIFS